jgi:hypothetical protein
VMVLLVAGPCGRRHRGRRSNWVTSCLPRITGMLPPPGSPTR